VQLTCSTTSALEYSRALYQDYQSAPGNRSIFIVCTSIVGVDCTALHWRYAEYSSMSFYVSHTVLHTSLRSLASFGALYHSLHYVSLDMTFLLERGTKLSAAANRKSDT
jgi:hypothetical protein